ncbi:MAG: UDP-N-acetylglucosamine 2-epimerase (non-hydrolyzing) [Anaerolineaceae bacterium]|nr:UDP-N-acetylglucosamine 2-epimerase (non-hydrolyzing) [Anaerolineaceae bacterium]
MKVLSIFGTRPEGVKMAPVVKQLAETTGIESRVCVTAQHREMLDQVLSLFEIRPDFDLDLMRPNQSLAQLTADIFTHLDPILAKWKPNWVLAQGDTTTVMAAALNAYYRRIRVGHVEAGLRTANKWEPFPEEINRRIAGVTADLHFAPTEHSRENLLREGIPDWRIVVTGNTVIDALQTIVRREPPLETEKLLKRVGVIGQNRRLILATAHRRENFGQPLENICGALADLAEYFQGEVQIVYPVHLNPNVHETALRRLSNVSHVTLLPPLDYLPLVHLMKQAALILTDSGGIQEEASALGIPTLVLRRATERPEGVESGGLKLVGTEREAIFQQTKALLEDEEAYRKMKNASNPFGDGHAAERIAEALLAYREPVAFCPQAEGEKDG